MKKTVLMLAVSGLMLATPSCKKGENDPGLSLSSRKARITGEWTVSSFEETTSDVDGSDHDETTTSFDGTNVTSTWSSTSGGTTTSGSSTDIITVSVADYDIEKDGSYTRTWNQVKVSTQTIFSITQVTTTTSTLTETGSWSFVGKAGEDYKKKERVVFNATSMITTSQATVVTGGGTPSVGNTNTNNFSAEIGENATTFDIDMLKGKEMTWKSNSGGTYTWTSAGSGGSSTTSTTSAADTQVIQLTAK